MNDSLNSFCLGNVPACQRVIKNRTKINVTRRGITWLNTLTNCYPSQMRPWSAVSFRGSSIVLSTDISVHEHAVYSCLLVSLCILSLTVTLQHISHRLNGRASTFGNIIHPIKMYIPWFTAEIHKQGAVKTFPSLMFLWNISESYGFRHYAGIDFKNSECVISKE